MRRAKVGAVVYVMWGLLHLGAALEEFSLGTSVGPGLVQGKLNQGAWNLLFCALASIFIAVRFNRHNSRLGYWLNLVVVGIADVGFLIFVFAPGYAPAIPSLFGPLLWITATILTTVALKDAGEPTPVGRTPAG
jgi:hypothetical protein